MSSQITLSVSERQDQPVLFAGSFHNLQQMLFTLRDLQKGREIGIFESTLITVRSDTLANFSKDFFLPTFINHALKIDSLALKVIMCIAALALDIVTLPIRIITLIPRLYLNATHPKTQNVMYRFLEAFGAPPELLNRDHIFLSFDGIIGKNRVVEGCTFNFIDLPTTATLMESHKNSQPIESNQ
jgi:hypothetical protein